MKRPVHLLEVFPVDVGEDFRGGNVGVAEEFLRDADVRCIETACRNFDGVRG